MSGDTKMERDPRNAVTGIMIPEMLGKNFEKLPDIDKKVFNYGPMYLGGNASLAGLVANSLYRRALHISQAPVTSSLPMAVLPFVTTFALYKAAVSAPLLSGDLNCPSCALIRGALIGLVGAGVYPIVLALPVNVGLATLYSTTPLPQEGNVLRYWLELSRPILRRMRAVLVLQTFFGTYLGSRDFKTYTKLAEMTFGSGGEKVEE